LAACAGGCGGAARGFGAFARRGAELIGSLKLIFS
jgi:hypothetical protein